MHRRISLGRRSLLGGSLLAMPALWGARPARAGQDGPEPVDVELVLAVDVSRSVDAEEMEMQFRGYANAFRDPRLIESFSAGPIGAIAVTLFTWSDWNIQEHLVPWMKLATAADAYRFAAAIDAAPRRTHLYTSISGAIDFAVRLFGQVFEGTRRVVDISGDGVNNSGRDVALARQEALERGIIINGLAVLDRSPPPPGLMHLPPLDEYFRDRVIGGPGAFVMVAEGYEAFEPAVRRKIIREVAGRAGAVMERAFA
ncbi:MAG: DUF1194 domain-containing protein [Rhodovarius sp.]|nr:DUF1194 domain-containing protein [Rhodovarius sp.]MDW8313324.1 DUF1194 domain-containing protein [Rhodovarius sp.]